MKRGVVVGLSLTLILMGFCRGAAYAQTKLVKPVSGGTIKITKSGSYFLGGNIVSALKIFPVISVQANNVTINLNGFTISDTATGTSGTGINASGFTGLTVVNGTITKIPGTAIMGGNSAIISGVQILNNNLDGLGCTTACLVTNNVVTGNLGTGINFSDPSSGYQNNILDNNSPNVAGGTSLGNNVCGGLKC